MNSIHRVLFLLLVVTAGAAVAKGDEPVKPIEIEAVTLGRPVDYTEDIAPILETNCVACHNVAIDEGDLSLEDVAGMLKGGGRGPAVVPGKPDEGWLLAVASHRREPLMPPPENDVEAKPLTPRELGLIKQWIIEGAGKGQAPAGSTIAWRALPDHLQAIHSVDLSEGGRFVAASRGNQVDIYDLPLAAASVRLADPNLSKLGEGGNPLYPHGVAHRDVVHAVAFHPDGSLLATAGYRCVKLWRRTDLGAMKPLVKADATVIAGSVDGMGLVVATGKDVQRFDLQTGKSLEKWTAPANVVAVAVSEDQSLVAAAGDDRSLSVWRVAAGDPISPRTASSPVTALAFAGDLIVSGHDDGVCRVWSTTEAQPQRELKGHTGPVHFVVFDSSAKRLITSGADGTSRVWDFATGKQLRSISHGKAAVLVSVSPDGKTLVSGGDDGIVRFWNLNDGKQITEVRTGVPAQRLLADTVEILDWRKQLAAVSETRLKSAEAALKDREEIHKDAVEARTAAAKALEAARTAEQEAAAAAKSVVDKAAEKPDDAALKMQVEEAKKKAEDALKKSTEAEEALRSAERAIGLAETAMSSIREQVTEHKQEKQLADEAVAAAERELASAKPAADRRSPPTAIAFSRNGDRVIVCDSSDTLQTFALGGQPLDAISGITVSSLLSTSEGNGVVLGKDGTVREIDLTGHWEYAGVLGPPPDAPLDLVRSTFANRVLTLAFSPDGRLLATGGGEPSRGGELMLWNVESRTLVRTIADAHSDTVQSVAFSRDGRILASAAADKFARTFNIESADAKEPTLIRTFEGHTDHVLGVALKADGTAIATASADLTVKIWNSETGEQQKTISGFGKQVTSTHFVGLSDEVVSSGGDKLVRLHNSSNGRQTRAFSGATDYVHSAAVTSDGSTIVAGGDDGILFVWDGKTGKIRHRFEPPTPASQATAAK